MWKPKTGVEQERQRGPKIKIEAAGSDEGPGARLDVPRSSQPTARVCGWV